MSGQLSRLRFRREFGYGCFLMLLAVVAWGWVGVDGWLFRDDAVYVYGGQRLLDGVMPYEGIFDHKTPLAVILCAVGSGLGRVVGIDDLLGARLLFGLLCVVSVPLLAGWVREVTGSRLAGVLGALLLIGTWSYGRQAIAGPNAKTPYVFFEILFLLAVCRRWWLTAGGAGALATWIWQPGIGFLAVGAAFAMRAQGWWGRDRSDSAVQSPAPAPIPITRYVVGIALPTFLLGGWFLLNGAFFALIEGSTVFNLVHLRREELALSERLLRPLRVAWQAHGWVGPLLIPGLAAMVVGSVLSIRREGLASRWLPPLLTLSVCTVFALLDFQGAADFYPFLPFAALGFGAAVAWAWQHIPPTAPILLRRATAVLLVLAMWLPSLWYAHTHRDNQLLTQRYLGQLVLDAHGAEVPLMTIGLPEILVLTGKTNPNRYVFIINGIDNLIAAESEGGFAGWLAQLEATAPPLIAWGETELAPEHEPLLRTWLDTHYTPKDYGYWKVYERR